MNLNDALDIAYFVRNTCQDSDAPDCHGGVEASNDIIALLSQLQHGNLSLAQIAMLARFASVNWSFSVSGRDKATVRKLLERNLVHETGKSSYDREPQYTLTETGRLMLKFYQRPKVR